MTIRDQIRAKVAIRKLARKEGVHSEDVRKEIQNAIDAAWDNQDPAVKWQQLQMFPAGKPTPEQFIARVARQI